MKSPEFLFGVDRGPAGLRLRLSGFFEAMKPKEAKMSDYDLSAVEAKYPSARFSAAMVHERLGLAKRDGAFIDQYAELTADCDGLGHVTAVAAPDGWTQDILMALADAQYLFYRGRGVDLTGENPELRALFEAASTGDTIETGGQRYEVIEIHRKKVLIPTKKQSRAA